MKNTIKITAFMVAFTCLLSVSCQKGDPIYPTQNNSVIQNGDIIQDQYIVVFKDEYSPATKFKYALNYEQKMEYTKDAIKELQVSILGKEVLTKHVYYLGLFGYSGPLNAEQLEQFKADPRVERVAVDRYMALAPPPGKGKGGGDGGDGGDGGTEAQQTPWGVQHVNGGIAPEEGRIAWILDTGIDLDHPDLNVNTSLSASFIPRGDADDDNGHGTHVAGIVGAIDNTFGVIGVAAGAEVVSVQVLDRKGQGALSDIIAGVQYVGANADQNDVANMSLGGSVDQTLDDAVIAASATCPFVLAAGNDNDDASNYSPGRIGTSYDDIYTIGAAHNTYSLDFWPDSLSHISMLRLGSSNYGDAVDYYQPGWQITSCYKNGGYETLEGTSMAAPHMSGLILIGYTVVPDSICWDGPGAEDIYEIGKIPIHQ